MNCRSLVDVPTQHIFGLDFANVSSTVELAERLVNGSDADPRLWRCVVTPNVDHLVRYERYCLEAEVARHASLVLPDGMPIVWASRVIGRPLMARLTGADLFAALWPRLARASVPIVAIVPNESVASFLLDTHPGARCIVPPQFDVDDSATVDELIGAIDEASTITDARFVAIGISMPKHHLIAARLREQWSPDYSGRPTVLLVGQSPEFLAGSVRRAPTWMQQAGLEWVWRLTRDPKRMARRYLVDDVAFFRLVWREWRAR